MTYTLIAYKSNGVKTCRGCEVESWDSEFDITHDLTVEELIARLALLRADNADPAVNGTWEWHAYEGPLAVVDDYHLEPQIAAAVTMETATRAAVRQQRAAHEQAARTRAERATDLRELARLKAKYESQS